MRKIVLQILVFAVTLGLMACNKEDQFNDDAAAKMSLSPKVQQVLSTKYDNLTAEQRQSLDRLDYLAMMLAQLSDNPEIVKEVKAGVDIAFNGDENILFKDMLDIRSQIFPREKESPFASEFTKLLKSEAYATYPQRVQPDYKLSKTGSAELEKFFLDNYVQIYWPHSEDWDGVTQPTVSFHPLKNEDVNVGYIKKKDRSGNVYYETVVVDEEYGLTHPVWIISFCEDPEPLKKAESVDVVAKGGKAEGVTVVQIG